MASTKNRPAQKLRSLARERRQVRPIRSSHQSEEATRNDIHLRPNVLTRTPPPPYPTYTISVCISSNTLCTQSNVGHATVPIWNATVPCLGHLKLLYVTNKVVNTILHALMVSIGLTGSQKRKLQHLRTKERRGKEVEKMLNDTHP
jgi:hypothetical protein